MVIFESQAHAKPTIPTLKTLVWSAQNAQDELLTLAWAGERPFLGLKTCLPKIGVSGPEPRIGSSDGSVWSLDDVNSSADVS